MDPRSILSPWYKWPAWHLYLWIVYLLTLFVTAAAVTAGATALLPGNAPVWFEVVFHRIVPLALLGSWFLALWTYLRDPETGVVWYLGHLVIAPLTAWRYGVGGEDRSLSGTLLGRLPWAIAD